MCPLVSKPRKNEVGTVSKRSLQTLEILVEYEAIVTSIEIPGKITELMETK